MELLLGIEPMNQLDAAAVPMSIFRSEADLRTVYSHNFPTSLSIIWSLLPQPETRLWLFGWPKQRSKTSLIRIWRIRKP